MKMMKQTFNLSMRG